MKIVRWACVLGLLGTAASFGQDSQAGEKVEIKLPHQGDVFGEGPEWDKQFAREALQIFQDLKPDPAWVAKLKALPDNTWLKCNPPGGEPEWGRNEVPMVYIPDAHAMLFCCGCGEPGYSSDTWLYHTGANRWVQMWPNFIKGSEAAKRNKEAAPRNRPFHRCSFGMAWAPERKRAVLRGGANAENSNGKVTWEYDPATNQWKPLADEKTGCPCSEANCLGYAPGLGAVEVYSGSSRNEKKSCKAAETWVLHPAAAKWEKLTTAGAPPGAECSRLVWAAKPQRLMYWTNWASQLWAFDPKALAWEQVSSKDGPKPIGFWRQGLAYDSANDVLLLFGSGYKSSKDPMGPWAYSFADNTWTEMKPAAGPSGNYGSQQEMFEYDPEHNVAVIACHTRNTWVYRFKNAPPRGEK